jgi:hypothetical protein
MELDETLVAICSQTVLRRTFPASRNPEDVTGTVRPERPKRKESERSANATMIYIRPKKLAA